jgi:hypothetical protein
MNLQTETTSTLPQESVPAEARVVLKGVSWSTFKALLADIGDNREAVGKYFADWLEWSHQQRKAQEMNPPPGVIRLRERIAKYGRDAEV